MALQQVTRVAFTRFFGARMRPPEMARRVVRGGLRPWCAGMTALALVSAPVAAQTAAISKVKAAFLYNFAKFAEWPADTLPPGQRLQLCVVGDDAVADALEQTIKGRAIEGHELSVRVIGGDETLRSCHMVYVDGRDARRSSQLLEALKGAPILSVGDGDKFAERGGVAQLVLEEDRMRFAVNVTAVERARLRLSSKLLSLASIVKEHP
jgi:hypothetical protein